jgi:outer membrane protein TolC
MLSRAYSLLLVATISFADSSLLSTLKQEEIRLDKDLANTNADKLGNDWISPITTSYNKSKSDATGQYIATETSSISITQPIFKTGGIYFAIRYAEAVREYSNISVDIKLRELNKSAMSLVYNLYKIDYQIKKQKLLLENAKIDVIRKDEQYKEGVLDSSFLDNAILSKNSSATALLSLQEQKEELIKSLKNISDIEYKNVVLPTYTPPTKSKYLNSIDISQAKADINQKEYLKKMTISNQLFTLNLNGTYSKSYAKDSNPRMKDATKNYGYSISIPIIDVNIFNKIGIRDIEYKQSLLALKQKQREISQEYTNYIDKIALIDEKIKLSDEDYELYDSLLNETSEKYSVGLVTKHDVDTLKNSKEIKKLDKKVYNLDKELLLVEMYSKIK